MIRLDGVSLHYGRPEGAAAGAAVGAAWRAAARGGTAESGPASEVLCDLTLAVAPGGFRWLLGPSGAGKTSLLRLLHLQALPTRGRMHVLGAVIAGDAPPPRRAMLSLLRRRIGMVFQDFRLLPHLSAFDNVALPLRIAGRPEAQVRADVAEMLAWVGLGAKAGRRPMALSGGEQQRVAIARAVVGRPSLLLADEPTGNLDEAQAERLIMLLHEMNRMGATVIVATHNDGLVARHPAQAWRLDRGRLVGDGAS